MTADDVLLEVLQRIDLRLDGSFVGHLGGLLERAAEMKLEVCNAAPSGIIPAAPASRLRRMYTCGLHVAALDVLVAELAQRNDLSGLQRRRIAGVGNDHLVISSSLTSMNSHLSAVWSSKKRCLPDLNPHLVHLWRTMTSKCLSLMLHCMLIFTSAPR